MRLEKSSQTILFGATSEIGNQILKVTQVGVSAPRYFFGRTDPGPVFRDFDVFVKFDANDLIETEKTLKIVLEKTDIECAIISYASMEFSNLEKLKESNLTNFNSTIQLFELLGSYFKERENRTGRAGILIYISSSVVDLNPRQKNYQYTASKIASEYYFKGLRDQLKKSGSKTRMILIKPGYTKTKLHAGEKPGPFATTKEKLGVSVRMSIAINRQTIYAPMYIKIPIFILSKFPSKFLNILDERL